MIFRATKWANRQSAVLLYLKSLSGPILSVCAIALAIMFAADTYLHHALSMITIKDAEDRAEEWAEEAIGRTTNLTQASRGQALSNMALETIATNSAKNGFVKFSLYSPDGAVLAEFFDPNIEFGEAEHDHGHIALEVFESGENHLELSEHENAQGELSVLVAIYMQARDPGGLPFGVIEVYVDSTRFSALLDDVFHGLIIMLIFGSALIYIVPSVFLVFQSEKLRAKDKKLLELSAFDPLTGALNRREFNTRSQKVFDERGSKQVGILFMDVDRFKKVNDELGHDFGDSLLAHISAVIRRCSGYRHLIGRLGGDEFIVIAPNTTQAGIMSLGVSIQAQISKPFAHNGNTITPSLSIGAHLASPTETLEQAIHSADLAAYRAKNDGRGSLVLYNQELGEAQNRRKYVEATLRNALRTRSGMFMEYQPIFGIGGETLVGFEALMRLHDANGASISPAEFIPIAEESGMIVKIGEISLIKVLQAAKTWPDHLFVSVNLSAIQFRDGAIANMIQSRIREADFDPSRLELEVTESVLLENESDVKEQLALMKAIGVSIALDDFGTGYSSLGYLWKYEVDKLKIDRMFLEGFDRQTEKYRQLIGNIVLLGQNLGMTVTIEGIENPGQLAVLTDMGCDQFQGFLLGRPMSSDDALALVSRSSDDKIAI